MSSARPATEQDLNWIIGFDRGDLGEELARLFLKRGQLFVGELDGRPAGLLRLDYFNLRFPIVGEIQVSKLAEAEHSAVAAALLMACEGALLEKGERYLLATTPADTLLGQAWFEERGFALWGRMKDIDGDGREELVFRKTLG